MIKFIVDPAGLQDHNNIIISGKCIFVDDIALEPWKRSRPVGSVDLRPEHAEPRPNVDVLIVATVSTFFVLANDLCRTHIIIIYYNL